MAELAALEFFSRPPLLSPTHIFHPRLRSPERCTFLRKNAKSYAVRTDFTCTKNVYFLPLFSVPPLPSRMLCPNNGIFLSDNETALKCLRNAPRPSRLCVGLQTSLISGARGCNLLTASWQKTCASGQN